VAVHGDPDAPRRAESRHAPDERRELLGGGVAHRVRDVDHGRAGLDGRGHGPEHEAGVRPHRVLARELDVVDLPAGLADGGDAHLDDLVLAAAQHVLEVHRRERREDVDARARRARERPRRGLDVGPLGPGERGHHGPAHLAGDGAHRGEVPLRRDRKARLDDVDTEPLQLVRDLELLRRHQVDAGGLLTVAQGGVEDLYAPHRPSPPCLDPFSSAAPAAPPCRAAPGSRATASWP